MVEKIEGDWRNDFCIAAKEIKDNRKRAREPYRTVVLPLIKRIGSLPVNNGVTFEIVSEDSDKNFVMGVKHRIKGILNDSIYFSVSEYNIFDPISYINAVKDLHKWMGEVAPERVTEIGLQVESIPLASPTL